MIVKTESGYIEGVEEDGVYVFKGIPYAKAPIGQLRFTAPQPVEPWGGVRSAKKCGPVSPQINKIMIPGEVENEDCLYLNVITPAIDGKKRPVMIWIHGGIFVIGSGSARLYRNYEFVQTQDVVLVTINYRLGPLGFLYFNDLNADTTGFDDNVAIRDQVAAVEWVIANIVQFGGDPSSITLWGQSAGATAVLTLLTVPSLQGKIKGAIAQSPSYHSTWSPEEATWNTRRFLQKVSIQEEQLQALKEIPTYKLIRAAKIICKKGQPLSTRAFVPTYKTNLLPYCFEEFVRNKTSELPPLIVGFTKAESILFTYKKIALMPLEKAFYEGLLMEFPEDSRDRLLKEYQALNTVQDRGEFISDMVWKIPVLQLGEYLADQQKLWVYELNWTSSLMRFFKIGSFHGIDLFLQFNLLKNRLLSKLLHVLHFNSTRRLGKTMQSYWGNFAWTQNPNSNNVPTWSVHHSKDRVILQLAKNTQEIPQLYTAKERSWSGVAPRTILEQLHRIEQENKAAALLKKEDKDSQ